MKTKVFTTGLAKPRPLARFFLVGLLFLGACSGSPSAEEPKSKERPAVPVTVASVLIKDVPIQVSSVGNVEAYSTVAVKSRVSGELVGVHFHEGQEVKEGDLLFTIDKAPYEVALKEALARLERDQALARKARDDVRRNAPLAERDIVSRQSLDQYVSTAEAAEALVKADQAAVENLQLQLGYCSIRSPISGRTGSFMIQKGNLVKANDENKSLLTVHQLEPIYVTFAVPEKYLGEINRRTKEGKMEVQVYTPENPDSAEPITGVVSFVNNTVEQTTATIRLKATFANKDRRLWPGQTTNVLLTLGVQPKAVIVPSQAIQSGQAGPYAFVVKQDQTAELRIVSVSRSTNGETVIEKGLSPGETVVTDGQLLLTSGARVNIKDQNSAGREAPKK
ncbi:MAG: efflux RND transporter periplasmic adaptor subunit [Deltaproteobacteria bacterium]